MSETSRTRKSRALSESEAIRWNQIIEGPDVPEDQLFRELAESLPMFIWAADGTGQKVFCNQQYLKYIGVESPSGMDSGWHLAVHPADQIRAKETWEAAVTNGTFYNCEYRLRRSDGVYRHFLARAFPLSDGAGNIVRWLGSSIDLHDAKLDEASLRESEKLSAASRFASSVAHQINNPLSGATNAIYLAQQDSTLKETTRSYLDIAAKQIARVAHVTARSLGFHKQNSVRREADIASLLSSVLGLFDVRLLEQSLAIETDFSETPPLLCYADDLCQAFACVLINSVQASEPGSTIRIRTRFVNGISVRNRAGIQVTIADRGTGIAEALRDKVFSPFVSTKGDAGVGLGLWTANDIIQRHGGSIRFRTRTSDSRGTVFLIWLPLAVENP